MLKLRELSLKEASAVSGMSLAARGTVALVSAAIGAVGGILLSLAVRDFRSQPARKVGRQSPLT